MRSIRQRVSSRLLEAGATLTLDRQQMWNSYQRSGVRTLSSGDAQVLFMTDLISKVSIRLGMLIMPRRLSNLS